MGAKLSELDLKQVVDALYFTIVTDENNHILCMSKNYRELLGLSESEVIGKLVSDIIPTSRVPIVAKTKVEEIGFIFELANGQNAVCNRIPIWNEGEFKGVITSASFADVSEVNKLVEKIEKLKAENKGYRQQIDYLKKKALNQIIGESKAIKQIKETLLRIACTDMTVLITGETGTGKEVVTNAIHKISDRYNEKFIKVNCASIPKDLLESELFGYEAGAFSGANKNGKIGKFELANNGSILLDEIGEMPLHLQSKLLRVLQEKEVERVGGVAPIKLNIRVMCNTNQNLEDLMDRGLFRRDLYYRINIMQIHIPPLRERKEDIKPLCEYFIEKLNNKYGFSITGLTKEAYNEFIRYNWDGNIRELEHALERASVMAVAGNIERRHIDFLTEKEMKDASLTSAVSSDAHETLDGFRQRMEKEKILQTLWEVRGNKSYASKMLGIDRGVLYKKMDKYGIK